MNKYDEPLDLESENSLSLIIDQIQPNTVILEFGPAMGRMTKYLTKELNCEVYIAELDKEAYEYVMNFAKGGVLGDVENYEWLKKFSNIEFDYIIFADVLEHLVHPDKVLAKAASLLKMDGRIMTSLPNIAYNAVIIDLIHNKFQYRNTGILDNTHLRFFTHESLEPLFHEAGLIIEKEKIVHLNLEYSGFDNSFEMLPVEQADFLKKRNYADAYQFVCTAIKKDYYTQSKDSIVIERAESTGFATMEAILYADTGSDFNENEKLQLKYRLDSNNGFSLRFELDQFPDIKRIRLDLSDDLITLQSVKLNSDSDLTISICGALYDGKYYFINEKASVFLENNQNQSVSWIELSGILKTPALTDVERILARKLTEVKKDNYRLEDAISQKQMEINESCKICEDKIEVINELNVIIEDLQKTINNQAEIINVKNAEIDLKNAEIDLKNTEIDLKNAAIDNKQVEISIRNEEIERYQNDINNILNSSSWKITKPLRALRIKKK